MFRRDNSFRADLPRHNDQMGYREPPLGRSSPRYGRNYDSLKDRDIRANSPVCYWNNRDADRLQHRDGYVTFNREQSPNLSGRRGNQSFTRRNKEPSNRFPAHSGVRYLSPPRLPDRRISENYNRDARSNDFSRRNPEHAMRDELNYRMDNLSLNDRCRGTPPMPRRLMGSGNTTKLNNILKSYDEAINEEQRYLHRLKQMRSEIRNQISEQVERDTIRRRNTFNGPHQLHERCSERGHVCPSPRRPVPPGIKLNCREREIFDSNPQ